MIAFDSCSFMAVKSSKILFQIGSCIAQHHSGIHGWVGPSLHSARQVAGPASPLYNIGALICERQRLTQRGTGRDGLEELDAMGTRDVEAVSERRPKLRP